MNRGVWTIALLSVLAGCRPAEEPARPDAGASADAAVDAAAPPDASVAAPCADADDGTPCDPPDGCVLTSACRGGACVPVRVRSCPVRPCMISNACDPRVGRCVARWVEDGSRCEDGNLCTTGERCFCDDGIECRGLECGGGEPVVSTAPRCEDGFCFTDVTRTAGIAWTATGVAPHALGGGAVMADLDGDGWLDLVMATESTPPALYVNDRVGGFVDRTASSGLDVPFEGDAHFGGITAGDYDNDGDLDLYIAANGKNRLLANDGRARFADVTDASGTGDERWSMGAAFGDMDGDGDLDLVVANYVAQVGSSYPDHDATPNTLYENQGDGTFVDMAAARAVGGASGAADDRPGATLVVAFTDFDQDGDVDLLECNDFGPTVRPNELYENDGHGHFERVGAALGADVSVLCMTIAQGDVDRDGDFDYYHTNIGRHALLGHENDGFRDITDELDATLDSDDCRPDYKRAGWGAVFEDFDNDGWLDLFVAGGYIPATRLLENRSDQRNVLLANRGPGRPLEDVSESAGVDTRHHSRGVAAGDYDRDGDVDLFVVNLQGAPELLRNDAPTAGRSLTLELVGRASSRHAPNALVRVWIGEALHVREHGVRPSFASASPTEIYVGAGEASVVDAVEVRWPSGIVSRALDVELREDGATRARVVEPWVTIEGVDGEIAPVPGGVADLAVRLVGRSPTPQAVSVELELQAADGSVVASERGAVDMGFGSQTVSVRVPLPSELVGSPFRWLATVRDAEGAVDQHEVSPR